MPLDRLELKFMSVLVYRHVLLADSCGLQGYVVYIAIDNCAGQTPLKPSPHASLLKWIQCQGHISAHKKSKKMKPVIHIFTINALKIHL